MYLSTNSAAHYKALARHIIEDEVGRLDGFAQVEASEIEGVLVMLLVPDRGPAEVFVAPDKLFVYDGRDLESAISARQYFRFLTGKSSKKLAL